MCLVCFAFRSADRADSRHLAGPLPAHRRRRPGLAAQQLAAQAQPHTPRQQTAHQLRQRQNL